MCRRLNKDYVFKYPKEFVTLPEYSKHRGDIVRIVRACTADEADNYPEQMYHVQSVDNSWSGVAWETELVATEN